jgi:hypothetical protein
MARVDDERSRVEGATIRSPAEPCVQHRRIRDVKAGTGGG